MVKEKLLKVFCKATADRVMRKRCILASIIGLFACQFSLAQNPVVQTSCTPDPAPYVYDDTVWLFADHDEDTAHYFRMKDWQLYSTKDMVNYTYRGTPMTTATFKWAKQGDNAWASQAIQRNGKWYWYVAAEDTVKHLHGIGVAVSNRPEGPYVDPINRPLVPGDWGFIDPSIFVDDDGQAYLFWGNNGLWYALLNDDMISLKSDIIKVNTEDCTAFGPLVMKHDYQLNRKIPKTNFEEAPWVYKIGKTYYLEYAAGGVPEHWAYSTADNINGPWTYRGRIMDESPNSFTIHGGSINYHGRDFMFYHCGRLPNGGGFRRSTSVEEFKRNADGSIPFIPITKEGVTKPVRNLDPFKRVEAETMADSYGLKTNRDAGTFHYLTEIDNGDWLKVRSVDFGEKKNMKKLKLRLRSMKGGTIEFRTSPLASLSVAPSSGKLIASVKVKSTGNKWKTLTTRLVNVPVGIKDLYVTFKGEGGNLLDFDWWVIL